MPYYREYFNNDSTTQRNVEWNGVVNEYPLVRDDAVMLGFRGKPHRHAYYSAEVAEFTADPYAYFLSHAAERRYRDRLGERGTEAEGSPDRGHAFELGKYTLRSSNWSTVTLFERVFGAGEFTSKKGNPVFSPGNSSLDLAAGDDGPLSRRVNPASSLDTFAQQAYARVAPTSVVFDAAQFLGELREGLPGLSIEAFRSASKALRGAGSDYLNVEFGWKPLINDIIKAGQALAGATDTLSGNGTRVHRRYGTPPQRTFHEKRFNDVATFLLIGRTGFREAAFGLPTGPVGSGPGPRASGYFLRTTERSQWFEGEFTNFMPLGFDPSDYLSRLNQLVNIKLTPEVLWELAPWSWLIDWNLRIGDTIAANELAANDLLVMHYGYAMEKTTMRDLLVLDTSANPSSLPPGTYGSAWQNLPKSYSYVATTEYKRRLRANPFGFRTGGTSALSVGQLSILGALGLTRLK